LHGLNPKVYTAICTVILIVYPVRLQSGKGRKGKKIGKNSIGRKARTGQNEHDSKDKTPRTGQIKQTKKSFSGFCLKISQAMDEV
jgi:hypothetical protein